MMKQNQSETKNIIKKHLRLSDNSGKIDNSRTNNGSHNSEASSQTSSWWGKEAERREH